MLSPASSQFGLSPDILTSLSRLELWARGAVEGILSGLHRSTSHGFGQEFQQYRSYTPGEDLKYLDWKVFARSSRLVSKVFEEETGLNLYLVIDCSGSMDFRGDHSPVSKWEYAVLLASCFAYLARRQGDSLGLFVYSDKVHRALEPSRKTGHFRSVLQALRSVQPGGQGAHQRILGELGHHLKRKGLVVYLSDMLEAESILPESLGRLRFAHADVMACQVSDPDEWDIPYERSHRFRDKETGMELPTYAASFREEYRRSMMAFQETLSEGLKRQNILHLSCRSSDALAGVLGNFLRGRGRR